MTANTTGKAAGKAAGKGRAPATTSTDRLGRLLALVPYVVNRDSVALEEAAAAFGVTEKQLIDDLNLLWCVELRAPDPYCPIDLSYEGGEITVAEAESIARPLRLKVDEAAALLVALRMLAGIPGLDDRDALSRVIAKLEGAAGAAAAVAGQVAVEVDAYGGSDPASSALAALRDAIARARRVHLTYYVPARDENTERDVDPMRLLVVEGNTYLEGWCRRAEAVRLFKLDRIAGLEVLDAPARVPDDAEPIDVDAGLFRPSPQDEAVTLELTPRGRWVADYYPCESVEELGEGRLRVVLRTPDSRWVRGLALRLGDQGRVVAPARLAAGIREDAARALGRYGMA
ncbi:helix-turn-helix transcriptional regulator [Actinomadura welshii]